jgi:hypothetical protein
VAQVLQQQLLLLMPVPPYLVLVILGRSLLGPVMAA